MLHIVLKILLQSWLVQDNASVLCGVQERSCEGISYYSSISSVIKPQDTTTVVESSEPKT